MKTTKIPGTRQILLATLLTHQQDNLATYTQFSKTLARLMGLKALRTDYQLYEPQGMTINTYLAESHMTLETYPEDHLVELEVASCKIFPGDVVDALAGAYGYEILERTVFLKNPYHRWVKQ